MKRTTTDRQWEHWGDSNPYFGVLGTETRDMSNPDVEARFLASGEAHIRDVIELIASRFGGLGSRNNAMDFGCGVGRLLPALATYFPSVTGVDVSSAMLAHAKRRAPFATLARDLSELGTARFDLVHSWIVLQHIRPAQGYALISELVQRTAPEGFFALHLTIGDLRPARRVLNVFRYRLPPLQWAYNLVRRRPWGEPVTEMNEYDFKHVMTLLRGHYEGGLVVRGHDHNGHVGVMIVGKRTNSSAPRLRDAAPVATEGRV